MPSEAVENPSPAEPSPPEPEAEAPGPAAGESGTEDPSPRGRQVLARHYETEQRVDGPSRWTVGEGHPACCRCHESFAVGAPFQTVLRPRSAEDPAHPEVTGLFERLDYCESCFAGVSSLDSFAHWRSVCAAPDHPAPKVVNLESLQATFEQLGPSDDEAETRNDGAGDPVDLDAEGDRVRLRYLLALYLVRRRVLRWIRSDRSQLVVHCVKTGRDFHVDLPAEGHDKLLERVGPFEELFG